MKRAAKPKTVARGAWEDLAEEKMQSSGLTRGDAGKLGIEYLTREQTARLWPKAKPLRALKLPYFDPTGAPLSDWPKAPPFVRVRYLEESTGPEILTGKKQPRYAQAPGTAPCAYFPRNQPDWPALLKDPSRPLILVEGEFKAAKACKEGFPAIGIGGVYNWRALKMGLSWLPSLEGVVWLRRAVYLAFDSDVRSNPMVLAALKELADELVQRGALVFFVVLPELKDLKKVGVDDFLIHAGESAREQFAGLLRVAEPMGLAASLWSLNERYVYVRDPGLCVQIETGAKVSPTAFRDHAESPRQAFEGVAKGDGISYTPTTAGAAWLKWQCRAEAPRITYAPGQPQRGEDGSFNEWAGWGYEPKKGDVRPWEKLVRHLFSGAESGALEWFLQWCAYPIQHPGTKLYTAVVVQGVTQGTGKSFVGYLLGRIYGDGVHGNTRAHNFSEVKSRDFHGTFNEWAQRKQFVLGDEVTGGSANKRIDADYFKNLITQKEVRINAKYVPSYTVADCVNYYLTANHPDAFFLEDTDRRFFIHEVTADPRLPADYAEVDKWQNANGPSALHYHLLHNVDTSKFNPTAPALRTQAKERMTLVAQSDLAQWVRGLLANPEQVLRCGDVAITRDLLSSAELLSLYDPERRTGTTAGGVARELSRAGARQVNGGQPLRVGDRLERLFAVRNRERWVSASPVVCAKHVADNAPAFVEPKGPKY